jgi:hypothetical protein
MMITGDHPRTAASSPRSWASPPTVAPSRVQSWRGCLPTHALARLRRSRYTRG